MLHTQSPTCTTAFVLSTLPPLSLLRCVFPLCSALSQLPREESVEMREGQKSESSLQNLPLSVSHSLDSLRHPSSSCCFAPVSGKSWPCLRGVPAPSAKPIDPLITCYSTSFRKERACTCTIYTYTLEHILTEKSSTLKHNRVLTKVLFLTSCQSHLLFFSIVMSLSPLQSLFRHNNASAAVALSVCFCCSEPTLCLSLVFACKPVNHEISKCIINAIILFSMSTCDILCVCCCESM